jgi:membrane protease YdiL (CAAX protease family)
VFQFLFDEKSGRLTANTPAVLQSYPYIALDRSGHFLLGASYGANQVGVNPVGAEEIVFRRCARHLFQIYLNDGYALVVVTSILFGAYHWWTGIGNIVEAVLIGVLLMLFYRRSAALWPVVVGHYLTDVVEFAL